MRRASEPPGARYVERGLERLDGYLADLRARGERDGFTVLFAVVPDSNVLLGPHPSESIASQAIGRARASGGA